MEKIYKFIVSNSVFHPYDMDFYLPPGIKFYTVSRNVVGNIPKSLTDNAVLNYTERTSTLGFGGVGSY